jgi:hypothetical protein
LYCVYWVSWVMPRRLVDLFSLVGEGYMAVLRVQHCRRWCHLALFGVFEGKEIIEVLKTA